MLLDQPIEVDIDEIQPRCRTPVTQQSRFDLLKPQRLVKQPVSIEVDLPYGKVVRRTPVGMHLAQLFLRQRLFGFRLAETADAAEAMVLLPKGRQRASDR